MSDIELADLRRRILRLSRDDLMRLVEGVVADWRAEKEEGERRMREEVQTLLAHEARHQKGESLLAGGGPGA